MRFNRTKRTGITVILIGITLAVLWSIFLGLWLSGFGSSKPASQLCTPAAVASFNAYWDQQVSSANYDNINQVLSAELAATAQRNKICGG